MAIIRIISKFIKVILAYFLRTRYILFKRDFVCATTAIYPFDSGFTFGTNLLLKDYVKIELRHGGKIILGDNVEIHEGVMLLTYGGEIRVGNNCSINPYSVIYGHGGLTIGNNVRIATGVVIIPANHIFDDVNVPIRLQGESRKGIKIEDNVWIGARVVILDGVTIGNNVVVAAGSVINKDVPAFSVVGGVPFKILKFRNFEYP